MDNGNIQDRACPCVIRLGRSLMSHEEYERPNFMDITDFI